MFVLCTKNTEVVVNHVMEESSWDVANYRRIAVMNTKQKAKQRSRI